jgi:hypothetical protein
MTTAAQQAVFEIETLAHHEAAHAVIALVGGGTALRARIWQASPTRWRGWTDMTFDETPDGDHAAALALLAGAPAERFWLEAHHVPRKCWPHDVEGTGAYDRQMVHECLARIPREQRPTFRALQSKAERLVITHWDRVADLAARLVADHTVHHVTR